MDGLYAMLDYAARRVRLCSFPYGLSAGRRAARRLGRADPPPGVIVPIELLPTMAPDDHSAANHFLMRAARAMLDEQNERAVPYLTAFSALARVRFAYITVMPGAAGVTLDFEEITATNYTQVHRLFSQPLGDQ